MQVYVEQEQSINFPVSLGPISTELIQMWARLVSQATTTDDLYLVLQAFRALWWESAAYDTYREFLPYWHEGQIEWAMSRLGHTVYELHYAVQTWKEVVQPLGEKDTPRVLKRVLKDVSVHIQSLRPLLLHLLQQGVTVCTTYEMAIPDQLRDVMAAVTGEG